MLLVSSLQQCLCAFYVCLGELYLRWNVFTDVADSLSFSLLLFFSFSSLVCVAFGWWRAGWLCVLGRSQYVRWVWCDDARGWMLDAGCLDACVRGWWIP